MWWTELSTDEEQQGQSNIWILMPQEGDLWTDPDTGITTAWDGDQWVETQPVQLEDISSDTHADYNRAMEILG